MQKTLLSIGVTISTLGMAYQANNTVAQSQPKDTYSTPNVRVLNNNTVSPTSSASKSVNTVYSSNDNNDENTNKNTNNAKSTASKTTATSTVSVRLIEATTKTYQEALNVLSKAIKTTNNLTIMNNGNVIYNSDGTGYYKIHVTDLEHNDIDGDYAVYQDSHIVKL